MSSRTHFQRSSGRQPHEFRKTPNEFRKTPNGFRKTPNEYRKIPNVTRGTGNKGYQVFWRSTMASRTVFPYSHTVSSTTASSDCSSSRPGGMREAIRRPWLARERRARHRSSSAQLLPYSCPTPVHPSAIPSKLLANFCPGLCHFPVCFWSFCPNFARSWPRDGSSGL